MTAFRVAAGDDQVRRQEEPPFEVPVDGLPVEAVPGQTVAAALLAAGRDSWRQTAGGRPRGVFCGIGACFDCLVVVNGIPDVRACQRVLVPGDTVTTQSGPTLPRRAVPPGPAATTTNEDAEAGGSGPIASGMGRAAAAAAAGRPAEGGSGPIAEGCRRVEVVVVGGGPAGMAAALAAADAGAEVMLVDSASAVGGQYHRQLPDEFHAERPDRVQHGWGSFAVQRDRIERHPRITHWPETSVWAIEPVRAVQPIDTAGGSRGSGDRPHRLRLQTGPADSPGRLIQTVDTTALVLATGAYDRVLPFPGWELPGVYSAGAAQALAKGQRIAVGRRVIVAGTGPFLLPVAESLLGVGADVVELLETNGPAGVLSGWLSDPLAAVGKAREAAGFASLLARHRIRLRHRHTVIAAHGSQRVEAVTVARLDRNWRPVRGSERRVVVDAVCLGFGFTAHLELAVSAGCELGAGPDAGSAVVVDESQRTSVPGVFAAGELTGIGGAELAAAEGRVAGASAAASLAGDREPARASDRKAVAKGKRFAEALAKAYPVRPGWQQWSTDRTVVCRCEEVLRQDLRDAVLERDVLGTRSLKLSTRAGLGLCQGRVCSRTVTELAAAYQPGVKADPAAGARRPIAVPVRLRDLAATPEPTTPEPATSEPATPETTTPEPATPELDDLQEDL